MKTLTVDANNDLVISNNSLAISTDLEAVLFACQHAVKAQYGEMIFAIERGIPYNVLAWDRQPNTIQLEAFIRRAILSIPNVLNISELEVTVSDHIIQYRATINTTYGIGTLDDVRISQ